MKQVLSVDSLRKELSSYRKKGFSIGFVPTMGYFHEGHLSLMRSSRRKNDVTVVSVFVNPIQFGPKEDFSTYPRDLKRDVAMARKEGVDILFAPSVEEMYPGESLKRQTSSVKREELTVIHVPGVSQGLCGTARPGHFDAVATVVAKLLHIVQPDVMYLGQKDAQQVAVIKKMITDLNYPVALQICPTFREADGLAMSSRNRHLSPTERRQANVLYQGLRMGVGMILAGERDGRKIILQIKKLIQKQSDASINYVSVIDAVEFSPVRRIRNDVLIVVAAKFGKTRLIDNVFVRIHGKSPTSA